MEMAKLKRCRERVEDPRRADRGDIRHRLEDILIGPWTFGFAEHRGEHRHRRHDELITPACAGKSAVKPNRRAPSWDYPRAYGEKRLHLR